MGDDICRREITASTKRSVLKQKTTYPDRRADPPGNKAVAMISARCHSRFASLRRTEPVRALHRLPPSAPGNSRTRRFRLWSGHGPQNRRSRFLRRSIRGCHLQVGPEPARPASGRGSHQNQQINRWPAPRSGRSRQCRPRARPRRGHDDPQHCGCGAGFSISLLALRTLSDEPLAQPATRQNPGVLRGALQSPT
jgi:hypothetical protein